jgi:5-formyltetrahydrofolate cyclo-ligase
MNSGELKRAKRAVRWRVLAARDALPIDRRERLGLEVVRRFLDLPEIRAAEIVLVFWSFGSEVPTMPLIDGLRSVGSRVALPRIVDGDLQARTYEPGDPLTATSFGALEPAAGVVLDPREIDAIAVPAVAFDREGHRVGYGGGFYDRFLTTIRDDAPAIGIGFELQLLPPGQTLPAGHFDRRIDLVVTEREAVRCGSTT